MSRLKGFALGALALGAAGLAAASSPVRAHEMHEQEEIRIPHLRGGGGHLGVVLEEVGKDDVARLKLPEERGAVVKEVSPETPAAKSGVKEGDVILGYQGEKVFSVAQLVRMVAETPPGRTVILEISRGGAIQRLSATLDERKGLLSDLRFPGFDLEAPPAPPAPHAPHPPGLGELFGPGKRDWNWNFFVDRGPRKLGIRYQELSGQLAKFFHVPEERGILVTEVDEGGPAAKGGLKAGDVILKFNGKAVREADDLLDEVAEAEPGQEATITVQRDGKPLDLKVTLGGKREPRKRDGETT